MRERILLWDADRHVVEPIDMWREYLEPEWRAGAPYEELPYESIAERVARLGPRAILPPVPTLMLDGEPAWHKLSERALVEVTWTLYHRPQLPGMAADPRDQVRSMDASGVEVAFLFPTSALFLLRIDSMAPARSAAFARAYNSWLRDYCRAEPWRLQPVGALSLHDPALALAELERVAGFGWKAVMVPPNPIQGRTLGHPDYEPLWRACERLGLALAVHEGSHARVPTAGADRFDTRFALNTCSHPLEQMMALLSLIESGVLERHPQLRVGFFESGCGWVPYWLWRMDEAYTHMAAELSETVPLKPSEYFRRQCYICAEPGEALLAEVVNYLGEERVLVGSDFPHADHPGDASYACDLLYQRLPAEAVRRLLQDNPSRFYGLER